MSQYYNEDISKKEKLTLKDGVTHLMTMIAFNNDCSFTIYDGLSMNLNKWTNMAVHLLKKYGIVGMDEQPIFMMEKYYYQFSWTGRKLEFICR